MYYVGPFCAKREQNTSGPRVKVRPRPMCIRVVIAQWKTQHMRFSYAALQINEAVSEHFIYAISLKVAHCGASLL